MFDTFIEKIMNDLRNCNEDHIASYEIDRALDEVADFKTRVRPTKRAADECQSHARRAKTTGFKFCPDCGNPLSTHR